MMNKNEINIENIEICSRFEVHLQSKLERADCAMDQLHIPFLLKQMRGGTVAGYSSQLSIEGTV